MKVKSELKTDLYDTRMRLLSVLIWAILLHSIWNIGGPNDLFHPLEKKLKHWSRTRAPIDLVKLPLIDQYSQSFHPPAYHLRLITSTILNLFRFVFHKRFEIINNFCFSNYAKEIKFIKSNLIKKVNLKEEFSH